MNTLADDVIELLQRLNAPLSGADVVERLGVDAASARAAFRQLNVEARADVVRLDGGLRHFAVQLWAKIEGALYVCPECGTGFERPRKSRRRCCSRQCGIRWSWKRPGVSERRREAIIVARRTPEQRERCIAINESRWARPGEHEKMSEQNRKRWTDPAERAKLARGIRKSHADPVLRKRFSEVRKSYWQSPEYREQAVASMAASKRTPAARALQSRLMQARWDDPISRQRMLEANRHRNADPAKRAKISRLTAARFAAARAARRTPERLEILHAVCAARRPLGEAALEMGESYNFVWRWARDLGLSGSKTMSAEARLAMRAGKQRALAEKIGAAP